uniref:ABC transporter ATP-binding protein n=1 Tax=Globodera pallida TaxID=36090 RepID=A0A183CSU6_GLOPA
QHQVESGNILELVKARQTKVIHSSELAA